MSRTSLMRHLLAWVLGALLLVWASFIVVGFRTGVQEADELTDGHLASVAALLLSQHAGLFVSRRERVAPSPVPDMKAHDYQQSLSVVVWDASGHVLTQTGDAPVPAFDSREGFADMLLGDPPGAWRTYSQWARPGHERKITVLLHVKERDELARDIAEQMALPGLWLLPIIALALGLAIRRGLRPLHDLSRDVRNLDVAQANRLATAHPHVEFSAMVDSINTLLERQQATLARERQVAGELAHELRTPLASVALHARSLRGAPDEAQRQASLARLELDALRAGQVLGHLLALARASRAEMMETAQPLDLAELARRVAGDYAQAALQSGHDLAFSGPSSHSIDGHALLLELALRNLVENALEHTPRGTTVEVQVEPEGRWVQVCDNGPRHGAQHDQGQAAARGASPLRGLGLGLGHRVVEKVAALHKACLAQVPAPPGFDTCYRITFL